MRQQAFANYEAGKPLLLDDEHLEAFALEMCRSDRTRRPGADYQCVAVSLHRWFRLDGGIVPARPWFEAARSPRGCPRPGADQIRAAGKLRAPDRRVCGSRRP